MVRKNLPKQTCFSFSFLIYLIFIKTSAEIYHVILLQIHANHFYYVKCDKQQKKLK